MKTIINSFPPNELTLFVELYPAADWENDFRNYSVSPNPAGHDYKEIKKKLIVDQGGLCAYCEKPIHSDGEHRQRVEHIHPKSDNSNPAVNWGLVWTNVLAVCTGGETENKEVHPLPANLSCDAHKNHCMQGKKSVMQLLDQIFNPLHLPVFPCLFDFEKHTGKLVPNENVCSEIDSLLELAIGDTMNRLIKTIQLLNLNCDRLTTERRLVLFQYNQEVAKACKLDDNNFKIKLSHKWFNKKWPSFFTTRRILLGNAAENYLQSIEYAMQDEPLEK